MVNSPEQAPKSALQKRLSELEGAASENSGSIPEVSSGSISKISFDDLNLNDLPFKPHWHEVLTPDASKGLIEYGRLDGSLARKTGGTVIYIGGGLPMETVELPASDE